MTVNYVIAVCLTRGVSKYGVGEGVQVGGTMP